MRIAVTIALLASGIIASSCNSSKSLTRKADNMAKIKGDYTGAIKVYKEALSKGADTAYVAAQIGEMYRLGNRLAQAEPFYRQAVEKGNAKDTVQFNYGQALKAVGKYEEAAQAFNTAATNSANPEFKARAEREALNAPKAGEIANNPTSWEINNYDAVNTAAADFSPVLFQKDLYFTSNRDNKSTFKGDGAAFFDLYTMKLTGKTSGKTSQMEEVVNKPGFMKASATFSKDGKMMVFAMSNEGSKKGRANVDLFISRKKGGKWAAPELLAFNNPNAWDSSPAFSPDGKSLYFASDRPGGQGGSDIYRVAIENGKFTKVSNMGEVINTAGDESFPFVSDDGKLYFSSDGHPGLGNLDIFVATRNEDKSIAIKNLGAPVNSTADDFGIFLKSPLEGYISSNREGGKGDDDIYLIRDAKNDIKNVNFILAGKTLEKIEGVEKMLPNTKVKLIDDQMNTVGEIVTGEDCSYEFKLDKNREYTLLAENPGHYAKRETYSTFGKEPAQEELKEKDNTIKLEQNLVLDPIKKDETFVLENILYDFNKWDIREDAALELDKLVTILKDNPTIDIELSSHTDSRGKADYNKTLSQKRAESAVAYIVTKGIEKRRITAKGYGFDKPVIPNAVTEEDHQRNRRTEFMVTRVRN